MLKNDLFDLIKSMSSTERRLYNIRGLSYQKKSRLKALFNLFVKYDDFSKLEASFKKNKGIPHVHKLYSELYQNLLKFLAQEEAKKTKSYELQQKIFAAKNLFERNLIDQAERILDKVIKEAEYYEMYELLMEAYSLKERIYNLKSKVKNSSHFFNELLIKRNLAASRLADIYTKQSLYKELFSIFRLRGTFKDKIEKSTFEEKINVLEFKDGEGFFVGKWSIALKSTFANLSQDRAQILIEHQNMYQLVSQHKHISKLNIHEYFYILNNYSIILIESGKLDTAQELLSEMDELLLEFKELRPLASYHHSLILSYHIKSKNKAKCLEIANTFSKTIEETKDIFIKYVCSIKIIVAFLLNREYSKANDFANTIFNEKMHSFRKDCYTFLLFYSTFIYIKMEYISLAESKLDRFKYFLRAHHKKGVLEQWCLNFLSEIMNGQKKDYNHKIQKALLDVKEMNKIPEAKNLIEISEIIICLENELEEGTPSH